LPLSVQAAQAAVNQAQAALAQAEASYQGAVNALAADKAETAASAQSSLNQAENTVALDKNALLSAQDQLAQAEAPPTAAALAQARAQVQSAEAQLASALASQDNDVLTAPTSGVIVASNYEPGDTVTGATPVFVLDNTVKHDLEVSAEVSEAEMGSVKVGDPVTVTVAAYPNQTFSGTVFEINPTPTVVDNVTEYTVLATVKNPRALTLSGMTANVSIVTGHARHVLTIPPIALQTEGATQGVYVLPSSAHRPRFSPTAAEKRKFEAYAKAHGLSGHKFSHRVPPAGSAIFVPVTVGLYGTSSVQVVHGLYAGEQILLVPPQSLSLHTVSFRGFGSRPGGRFFHGR
jgi:HlyD family secretion protein